MANTYAANVIFVDTTAATYEGAKYVCAVKYVGNTSGTAAIKKRDASGQTLWAADGTADFTEDVDIVSTQGIHVTVTNGATVYIYLK